MQVSEGGGGMYENSINFAIRYFSGDLWEDFSILIKILVATIVESMIPVSLPMDIDGEIVVKNREG